MSYIGVQTQHVVSPQFQREVVTGTGTDVYTLIQDVPGFNADNITVVVNNVLQEPNNAYTITADGNGNPRVLNFNGTNLAATDECYVQHKGVGTLNITPAAGSVNAAALADNLKSGNVDQFLGSQATNSSTQLTLSEAPLNANSISVFLGGVYQRPTTNYTVSGTTLTFTGALAATDEIDVHHHTIRSTVTHVADQSVTTGKIANDAVTGAKIENNPTIAGNLTVSGTSTLTGNTTVSGTSTLTGNTTIGGTLAVDGNTTLGNASTDTVTIPGNLTVSGTTTTIDTTLESVDKLEVGANSTDYGAKINQAGTGNILQLQDGGTDKVVVADGGATTFSANITAPNIIIGDTGNIGSASDPDAIAIAANGKATFSAGIANTGTIDAGTIGSSVVFPAGTVLQVKQTVKTDRETIAGHDTQNLFAFVPAQGGSGVFQETITITGSNKVLIDARIQVSNETSNFTTQWAIFRGAATDTAIGSCTKIAIGTEAESGQNTGTSLSAGQNGNQIFNTSMLWLDAPSAGTYFYKIGWYSENNGVGTFNRTDGNTNAKYVAQVPSTITLYEVAA